MRFLMFALIVLLAACGNENAEQKKQAGPPAVVNSYTVVSKPWLDAFDAVGTVKAKESTVIAAKNSDRIATVHFESGDQVAKGQVLVVLDSGAAQADLAEAKANLADLNAQLARFQSLLAKQLVAKSQFDTIQANQRVAQARVQAAQERLNDRIIRAPFSGVLGLRQVSPGQFVSAGFAMVNLDDLSNLWVDFPIPENALSRLAVGMPIELRSDAYPDQIYQARIASIDSRLDVATRAVLVRAKIEQNNSSIRPGMLLRVRLLSASVDALLVPELAVQQVGSRSFVYLLQKDGTVRSQDVVVGSRTDGSVKINQGLQAGDVVVSEGTSKLRDGQKVQLSSDKSKASKAP